MEDPTEDVVENEMRGRIPAVFRKHKCRKEDYTPVCDRVQQVQVVLSSIGYGLQIGTISSHTYAQSNRSDRYVHSPA